ncbi:MAG: hypothetical protein ACI8PZ_001623 [Myxococcota bacterium]|jgi:hypothetical protein
MLAAVPTVLAYAALVGLGLHRHGAPMAVSGSATILAFGPVLLAGSLVSAHRLLLMSTVSGVWCTLLLLVLPLYFPGERRDAVASGLALIGLGRFEGVAQQVADTLPDEPQLAAPTAPTAALLIEPALPPATPLGEDEIALPFEGEGRRLSVPVVFGHGGAELDAFMMLDTGATYTTLPLATLAELGVVPTDADPVITLHTANGERDAKMVLLDSVWLGDLRIDGVAIATCDACASADTVGLLGLNVAGGFNLTIDSDRGEVVFAARSSFDRHLDVKPFLDLDATFQRFPGGRVEVDVNATNRSQREIGSAVTGIQCGEARFGVDSGPVAPGETIQVRRRLPAHEPCSAYEIGLDRASW